MGGVFARRSALLAVVLLAGCASDGDAPPTAAPPERAAPSAEATPEGTATPAPTPSTRAVDKAHCPPDTANCAAVTGRVLYVEAVDPDGDGDAHFVLAGGRVTAPGVSVVDVGRDLRPRRLPRTGDVVSAAGPVYTGSYGQQQIEAVELHLLRR
jgi:hypothetical protein